MREQRFRYELRAGNEIVATGHLTLSQQLHVGDEIAIGSRLGTVTAIDPIPKSHEHRLVVKLISTESAPSANRTRTD